MRWSIRYQLLLPLLALLLGIVAAISAWTAFAAADRSRRQIETRMRRAAEIVDEGSFPLVKNVLVMTKGLSGAEYLVVKENQRITTLESDAIALPPAETITDDPATIHLGPRVRVGGQTYFCSGVRVRQGTDDAADLYIFYPESLWRDARWEAIFPSLIVGLVGGATSLILAASIAKRLSQRIREVVRRTCLIAGGDFSPMPLPQRNDELRDLVQSVNDMAEHLAQLQDAVKKSERLRLLGQVSGGLAHQLRNGVAGARLAVQLHARSCRNDQADAEALDVALRQLALVESNLKRFLDLGRADDAELAPRRELCSLRTLIDEAVTLLRPQCRHAHIDLRWQAGADIHIEGDPGQLGHLLLNVLGNAMEAAGPGGWVEVKLQIANCKLQIANCESQSAIDNRQSAIIEVSDSGPGPAAEVAERLFDPFVTGKREGVGLGLAVARRVAEAHGGSIQWRREEGQTCFTIALPTSEPEA